MADARILKTRAALATAMLALAAEGEFSDVTVAAITRRANVGYATFFRHFRSKEALLEDVADVLMDEILVRVLPALLQEDTKAASVALCRFVAERRSLCTALLAGGAAPAIRGHLTERVIARVETVNLPQPSGLPPNLLIIHAVTATLGLIAWWLDHDNALDTDAMGAVIDRLVMAPVRSG